MTFYQDVATASTIVFLPFLIYSHLLFDKYPLGFTIFGIHYLHHFPTNDQFIWHFLLKFIPVGLYSIWFITNSEKWRYLIFIPIVLCIDSIMRLTIFYNVNGYTAFVISILTNVVILFTLVFLHRKYFKTNLGKGNNLNWVKIFDNKSKKYYNEFTKTFNWVKSYEGKKYMEFQSDLDNVKMLYYAKEVLKSLNNNFYNNDNQNTVRFRFIIFSVFIITPILFSLHHLIPPDVDSITLFNVEIPKFGFPSFNIMLWLFSFKLLVFLLLGSWFITCPYWWRYAILSPVILNVYQLWEMFQDVRHIEAWGNLRAVPYILLVLTLLIYLSDKIRYEVKIAEISEQLDQEIEKLLWHDTTLSALKEQKQKLQVLRTEADKAESASSRIRKLQELRDSLIRQIEVRQ